MKKRHLQKLLILSFVLWMVFNIPLVLLFNSSDSFFGFPVVYAYVFSIWSGSILVSFFIVNQYDE